MTTFIAQHHVKYPINFHATSQYRQFHQQLQESTQLTPNKSALVCSFEMIKIEIKSGMAGKIYRILTYVQSWFTGL